MNIRKVKHLAELNKDKTLRIYNPSTDDFTVKYEGKEYSIGALDMQEYPYHIANHIKKHLADYILHERGIKTNPQDDLAEIKKEIEVSI